jgi:glutathione peroxidase
MKNMVAMILKLSHFPSNDFGSQEPGTNEQINEFCTKKYGVSFTLMEKISIKGDDMHPFTNG